MRTVLAFCAVLLLSLSGTAHAAPTFPKLTGRVVDGAGILSPATETQLTERLAALEASTTRQVVVVTLPSLQGQEIEDYGYQLGRAWGIGQAKEDNGALIIVAPNERKVRIEVGYGLEPVLTDALSSVILQTAVLPRFRDGDMEGGVVAGTDAVIAQLALPDEEAKAKVAQAARVSKDADPGIPPVAVFLLVFFIFAMLRGFGRGRRRRGLAGALPWIIASGLSSSSRDGGGWSGGGGFSGGGGSFGGGGSSGSW